MCLALRFLKVFNFSAILLVTDSQLGVDVMRSEFGNMVRTCRFSRVGGGLEAITFERASYVVAYIVMAYVVMASTVVAFIVIAYIVVAYFAMVYILRRPLVTALHQRFCPAYD